MHLAQVVSFVSLCATRTWKNWKTPSTLKLSLTECAGVDYDYNWGLLREVHGAKLPSTK